MVEGDDVEQLTLMTQNMWGSNEKTLNLEVDLSIKETPSNLALVENLRKYGVEQDDGEEYSSTILEPQKWHDCDEIGG